MYIGECAVITANDCVYTFGSNGDSLCDNRESGQRKYVLEPYMLNIEDQVKSISCSGYHTVLLTKKCK